MDLNSEEEKYLCNYFDKPVFVIEYPSKLKAFYMKNKKDQEIVSNFDLLVPEIGELIGGSERENNYDNLLSKANKFNININNLN